ncbi:MAG TPA: lamin tail domain-containing protein, partial [Chthoniobacteraceae bacterium]
MKIFSAWFALLLCGAVSILKGEVLINEIHYDPSDRTKPLEFIEIHNSGAEPVNVGGWRVSDGIDYLFPANAVIAAGGYYVIAENAAAFQAEFSVAPHGVFTGSLSNRGERLRLQDSSIALRDEVSYGIGFPWPTMAKGGGGSIELINPGLDNDLGGSWRTAGTSGAVPPLLSAGDSQWHYRKGTSEASTPAENWRAVAYVEDGTWIANARMPIGYGDIDGDSGNSDVSTTLSDMSGSYRSIFMRRPFTVAAGQTSGSLHLRVRCDDGCIVWLNGVEIARVRADGAAPTFNGAGMTITNATEPPLGWTEIAVPNSESLLVAGSNILAVQAFNGTLSSSDFFFDAELGRPSAQNGSPAAQNSVFSQSAPPAIRQVAHAPTQPAADVPVTISAKVTDPQGVASVSLSYQLVDPGSYIRLSDSAYATSWTTLAMRDDGTNGDLVARDDTFSAVLPASLQTHRRLTRYRITAADALGTSVRVPYADDEQPNFAYFTYNGVPNWNGAVQPGAAGSRGIVQTFPSALLAGMQTWHLVANSADVTNSQYDSAYNGQHFNGTVIYEGNVYDHITFRNRGIGSTYVSGKNKWALSFNRARDVHVRDNWGNLYKETWNSFPIDACASPWAAVHRGMAGVEEAMTYRLYELAGALSLRTHYMHWRVIDSSLESGPTQYDG